jgi:sister chromatid cohesion protein DCC1
MRFAGLFLPRERWNLEGRTHHINPYLSDIMLDTKDLDKLLLMYAKTLMDKDGSWFLQYLAIII